MELETLSTPALLIDLDRVRANLDRMLAYVGGQVRRWRPHVKTCKIPEVLDLLLERGLTRFKCATTREARVLLGRSEQPIDLLLAMPHRGANLERVAELSREFPQHRLSLLVEDPEHAERTRGLSGELGLWVDLNSGFDRTGIPRSDRGRARDTACAAGPALRGVHDYEGHVRTRDPRLRREQCRAIYDGLIEVVAALRERSIEIRELVTSGTPTFEEALRFGPFAPFDHQVGPGTVVYWDGLSEGFGLSGFAPAATVLTRIVSRPAPGRVTCDAGSKAIDAASGIPCARVEDWPGLVAERPSEEHLPLRVASGPSPEPGALLRLIPAHVCPTVNLADRAVLVEGGNPVRVAGVAARGHDL